MTKTKRMIFSASLLIYILTFQPFFETSIVVQAIMSLIIIQVLWIGGVFPLAFSSLLLMLLLSVHFFTFTETLSYFGSEIVWLLFATFILAGAFIESGLASRLSLKLLSLSKGSSRLLVFSLLSSCSCCRFSYLRMLGKQDSFLRCSIAS